MSLPISPTANWKESRKRITGSKNYPVVASLFLLPLVGFSIFSIYRDNYVHLWCFVPLAICVVGLIGQSNTVRHRRWQFVPEASGITVADHSTFFDTAHEFKTWANVVIFSGIFTGTVTAIGFMNGTFEYLSRGRSSPTSGVILAGGFAVVLFGRAILMATARQHHLAVRCGPETLTFVKMFRTWTIRWEDIDRIDAYTEVGGTRNCALFVYPCHEGSIEARLHRAIPLVRSVSQPTGRAMNVKADLLEVGAEPLRWFLQHYLEHPEHRPELADERARQRLLNAPVTIDSAK